MPTFRTSEARSSSGSASPPTRPTSASRSTCSAGPSRGCRRATATSAGTDPTSPRRIRPGVAHQHDELLNRIRQVPGFEHFLRPAPFDVLRRAAQGGTIVLLNVSDEGCHALAVTTDRATAIPLPIDVGTVAAQTFVYLNALEELEAAPAGTPDGDAAEAHLDQTLAWLWDAVAGPVLDALGHTDTPADGRPWPRVWWCPTSGLTMLPIHAAGYHGAADGRAVIDRVVSSHTPTLGALLRARRPSTTPAAGARSVLAIGLPRTPEPPGLPDLPGVDAELAIIRRHVRRPAPRVLVGPAATTAAVLDLLPAHPWIHLACHGSQNLTEPSENAVYLYDGPLSVPQIARLRLDDAQIAVLSACQTATGGRLLEEALHLAAGFQLAGYRHVIAAQWTINDAITPRLTDLLYRALAEDGTPDPAQAATALHHALRSLRARRPGRPVLWMPYLHIGP
ncbi:CHAT domain-containing protein [Cryptosporangium sp. NPDC051539]|uniref:CHAT domain-containing protein n=1 Tax=Cryptosporangium sp. NPDC051539 TaxID=3363962 RepID=UPI00378EE049